MNSLTAHEFYAKHPDAKSFPSMKEARAWQDAHGGQLWHVVGNGSFRIGPAQGETQLVLVTPFSTPKR